MINMRGLKLQKAIQLSAEEILTESEIAEHLNVSLGTLAKLSKDPIFTRRVGQERAALRVERSAGRERGGEQTVRGFYESHAAEKRASISPG
jgi:hypothetical protein